MRQPTLSAQQREDLQALCEIYLMEGISFGELSREIRSEFGLGVSRAVDWTIEGLRLVNEARISQRAQRLAIEWHKHVKRDIPSWLRDSE